MAQFKPIMVESKDNLSKVDIIDGQYIVVINPPELYLDKDGVREKASQNIYTQTEAPEGVKAGDIWFVTEE